MTLLERFSELFYMQNIGFVSEPPTFKDIIDSFEYPLSEEQTHTFVKASLEDIGCTFSSKEEAINLDGDWKTWLALCEYPDIEIKTFGINISATNIAIELCYSVPQDEDEMLDLIHSFYKVFLFTDRAEVLG